MNQKDKKVTLLNSVNQVDSEGYIKQVWEPVPGGENIWAYYRYASGSEVAKAYGVDIKVEAFFEINWRTGVTTEMRILYKGDVYDITKIDDFEGNKTGLRLYANKIQGEIYNES